MLNSIKNKNIDFAKYGAYIVCIYLFICMFVDYDYDGIIFSGVAISYYFKYTFGLLGILSPLIALFIYRNLDKLKHKQQKLFASIGLVFSMLLLQALVMSGVLCGEFALFLVYDVFTFLNTIVLWIFTFLIFFASLYVLLYDNKIEINQVLLSLIDIFKPSKSKIEPIINTNESAINNEDISILEYGDTAQIIINTNEHTRSVVQEAGRKNTHTSTMLEPEDIASKLSYELEQTNEQEQQEQEDYKLYERITKPEIDKLNLAEHQSNSNASRILKDPHKSAFYEPSLDDIAPDTSEIFDEADKEYIQKKELEEQAQRDAQEEQLKKDKEAFALEKMLNKANKKQNIAKTTTQQNTPQQEEKQPEVNTQPTEQDDTNKTDELDWINELSNAHSTQTSQPNMQNMQSIESITSSQMHNATIELDEKESNTQNNEQINEPTTQEQEQDNEFDTQNQIDNKLAYDEPITTQPSNDNIVDESIKHIENMPIQPSDSIDSANEYTNNSDDVISSIEQADIQTITQEAQASEQEQEVIDIEKAAKTIQSTNTLEAIEPIKQTKQEEQDYKEDEQKNSTANQEGSLPLVSFFKDAPINDQGGVSEEIIDSNIENLLEKLKVFKINGDVIKTYTGPIVTTFEFKPTADVKVSKILGLQDDLAMALSAPTIRIQAPIPGKDVVGIEVPNKNSSIIYMKEMLSSDDFKNHPSDLAIILGKDIVGRPYVTDLAKLPHLLIAGTTGSGKSVGINAMILSLLYKNTPQSLRMVMIDPKMIEFSMYDGIAHLLAPVIVDANEAINALANMVGEMERRYKLMSTTKTKNIENYNKKAKIDPELEELPYIVIIIDELADLMMTSGKEVEISIARLAQKARACGMHLIVATQRPSVDVVTGLIKANFPSRLSYKVGTKTDSKVILDSFGAESLLGRGDLLFTPPGESGLRRLHAPWSEEGEIEDVVEFIKKHHKSDYDMSILQSHDEKKLSDSLSQSDREKIDDVDELYDDAVEIILRDKKTSISYLQRKLNIGYNRSATIIDQLEANGVLSAPNTKGNRNILIDG